MPTARSSTEVPAPAGRTRSPTCGTCSASAPRPYAARAPTGRRRPGPARGHPRRVRGTAAGRRGRAGRSVPRRPPRRDAGRLPRPGDRLVDGLGRRPRADPARAGGDPPDQPPHRAPRGARPGPAQLRVAAPGLAAARRHRPRHRPRRLGRRPAGRRRLDRAAPPRWPRSLGWVVETVRRTHPRRRRRARPRGRCSHVSASASRPPDRLLPLLDGVAHPRPRRRGHRAGRRAVVVVRWSWPWPPSPRSSSVRVPAGVALRRTPREELKVESGSHPARPLPASDLAVLRRIDRASVWRSVPMRRGLVVLALGPGLVALAGGMDWAQVLVLPALVVSGGALLFGVNAWCLDGRGALWRESLPVGPGDRLRRAGDSRSPSGSGRPPWSPSRMAALRAGVPSATEVLALVATLRRGHRCRWWPCRCRGRVGDRSRCSCPRRGPRRRRRS